MRVKQALFLLMLMSPVAHAGHQQKKGEDFTGKVVSVLDGDTIDVLTMTGQKPKRVRLAQIDAPEKKQPWGQRAKEALSDKIAGADVSVHCHNTDRYGRCVGDVLLQKRDINREMVAEGHAWVYRQYAKDQTLFQVEAKAQKEQLGLWKLPTNERLEPWAWRSEQREAATKAKLLRAEQKARAG